MKNTLKAAASFYFVLTLSVCLTAQMNPSAPERDVANVQELAVNVAEGRGPVVRGFCATVPLGAGRTEFAHVFAFFDPSTGAFWWKSNWHSASSEVPTGAVKGFLKDHMVRKADKHLVVFWTADMPAELVAQESALRVNNVEDAWRAVRQELSRKPLRLREEDKPEAGIHVIQLHKLLDETFFTAKPYEGTAMRPFHPPDIKGIDYGNSRWTITLAGANGLTTTVVLDDRYRPIKTGVPAATPR